MLDEAGFDRLVLYESTLFFGQKIYQAEQVSIGVEVKDLFNHSF